MTAQELVAAQTEYFLTGATLPIATRKKYLRTLFECITRRIPDITAALFSDLGKSATESYMTEIGMTLGELKFQLRHLAKWARPKRVKTPLAQFSARSYVLPSPYGVTLIMSPWNYPFMLCLSPLIDALASGNTAVIKPSAYASATSTIIKSICAECFDSCLVTVIEGGRAVNAELLDCKFDYIFFTGSVEVGRLVMSKAAQHLTPITLELGGKSPCIVDASANLALTARRIVFGKFLNLGQTCVAPDYLLIDERVRDQFLPLLYSEIKKQYGESPLTNPSYGKIINEKHFTRILRLLEGDKLLHGGRSADCRLEPTVLESTLTSACMQEEIFAPILPILTYQTLEQAREIVLAHPTPLALYLFTSSKSVAKYITENISFGGGCINDCIIHLATSSMGFGGVGTSGMGATHGKVGFDTFTHYKSMVNKHTFLDLPIRYQPYTTCKTKTLKKFM